MMLFFNNQSNKNKVPQIQDKAIRTLKIQEIYLHLIYTYSKANTQSNNKQGKTI